MLDACLDHFATEEQLAAFNDDGYLIVEDALPPDLVQRLNVVIDRIDAEKAFLSNNPETIIDALERITFFDTSPFYIQEKCIKHLKSDNIDIQIQAITSTGYLALLHGKLDKDKVIPLIESLSKNPALTQLAKDTLEDIKDNLQVRRRSDD